MSAPTSPHRTLRRGLLLAAMLALLLALTACVAEEPQTPVLVDPTGFVRYVHSSGVFTLSLPPDWVVSDTSTEQAINVAFSPPGSPVPLIGVYVASAGALGRGPAASLDNASGVTTEIDGLIGRYQGAFYGGTDRAYKEVARTPQPDGSLRIDFLLESAEGTSQHNDFVQVIGPYFVALRTRIPQDPALQRTLTRIANTLSVDATSVWASAGDGSGAGSAADVISFANVNHWVDRNGGFVVVGQVYNNATIPLAFVRVNAVFYDDTGEEVAEQDGFVSSDLVLPGETAPFAITLADGIEAGTVRYDLESSARYADLESSGFYGPQNFAITSQADFDDNGTLVIGGQLRNEGQQPAGLVKVIVTLFDEQQRLVGTDTTLVDEQKLAPGEASTFSVNFYELGGEPSKFIVTAQGVTEDE